MTEQEGSALDQEIRTIAMTPSIGEEKKGDRRGVFVHTFNINTAQYLYAYRKVGDDLELFIPAPHENYYRDLKQYPKKR